MPDKPMLVRELCERLGIEVETFYRTRARYHVEDKLPSPLTRHRPFRWDRNTIEAWLGRFHPNAPRCAPANDTTAPVVPDTDELHRAHLHQVYGAQ